MFLKLKSTFIKPVYIALSNTLSKFVFPGSWGGKIKYLCDNFLI